MKPKLAPRIYREDLNRLHGMGNGKNFHSDKPLQRRHERTLWKRLLRSLRKEILK